MILMKKSWLKRVSIVLLSVLLLSLFCDFFATKLIYDASFARTTAAEPLSALPQGCEPLCFSEKENRLQGYLFRQTKAHALIVIAPGLAATLQEYLPLIRALCDAGFSVFYFDPLGSGRSDGDSALSYAAITADLSAALSYVRAQGLFEADRLFLLGHSRGGYAACLCTDDSDSPDAVIAVDAHNCPTAAACSRAVSYVGPLAYLNFPMLWFYGGLCFDFPATAAHADAALQNARVPVLLIQAQNDAVASPRHDTVYAKRDSIKNAQIRIYLDESTDGSHISFLRPQSPSFAQILSFFGAL